MKPSIYLTYLFYFILTNSLTNGQKRPHIVFILADDLGWGDVSLHGSQQVKTPNIDVLASNGIILNNYYVSPLCSPSRSALMTGYHPIHTGFQHDVLGNSQPFGLPLDFRILPQYLKKFGYESHLVGKWHLGFYKKEYLPTRRGFDSHFGFYTGHTDYYDRTAGMKSQVGYDFRYNEEPLPLKPYEGLYLTDILTNKSVDIIMKTAKESHKPLFLLLSHAAVHGANKDEDQSLQAPQRLIDRNKHIKHIRRKKFASMVSALDDSVGEVFSALQRADILNETIIIFSTDNGGATGGSGGWNIDRSIGSNWPLRGAKYTLFEGGIRGFAFIWSALLKNQYTSDHLMHIQDWLPTIYSAIGANIKDLGPIDGIDFWNVLNNKLKSPRKQLLHNIDDIWKVWALRDGDYKLIYGTTLGGQFDGWFLPPGENEKLFFIEHKIDHKKSKVYKVLKEMNFVYQKVKQIRLKCDSSVINNCNPKENPCLFNVWSDPCEYNNLFDTHSDVVESMLYSLSVFNSSAVKPITRKSDPKSNPKYHNNWWSVWR